MVSIVNRNDAYKSYCNNISRMEGSKSCFICVDCPNNFYFSNWDDFKAHNCINESKSHFECIYCGLLVLWKNGEAHINTHFNCQNNSLYSCSICLFSCNNEYKLMRHYYNHKEINSHIIYRCTGCEESFISASDLIEHVNFYTIAIYNCCVMNCFVKSRQKFYVYEHYKQSHPKKSTNFEINLFLACSERTPDTIFTRQLVARVPSIQSELTRRGSGAALKQRPSIVYLECYKCDFSSSLWHSFIRHHFKCGFFDKRINEDHCVYICSSCATMSTKKHLVDEHLLSCDKNATVVTEVLPIKSTTETPDLPIKEDSVKHGKRSLSLSSDNQEIPEAKRSRINESPESKCKTEEAIISDFEAEDLNTEFVSIPFDEEGFRGNNPNIPFHQKETIITKMRQFSQCQITIVGKENYGRIPECPDCHKIFTYGFGDFKRHYMSVHLDIEKEYIKECLKYTRLPKGGDKFQEMQEQLTMRNLRPKALDKDKIRVPLPYSIVALRQLTVFLPVSTQQYLSEKMKAYSIMSIIIQNFDNSRRFLCNQCSYSSPYALADVRKHIMGSHCGISTKHFRYCLQASRLDPNEFTLLPDEKILNLAKDLSRRTKQKSLSLSNSSPTNVGGKSTISPHNTRYQKWSKTANKAHGTVASGKTESASVPPTHTQSLGGRKGVNALFLNCDSNFNLTLPFSEKVLHTLLQTAIADDQIPGIIHKMRLYSNYSLKRLCKNERTVAFQCPCGRVFHTARVPDLKMRAATLADARRHVMGVHAKIPQTLITVCCQASRICRENDFQIYSDEMLLQLAAERQAKLLDTQSRSNAPEDSSSKSHDLQADSSVDPGEQCSPINDHEMSSPIPSLLNNSIVSSTHDLVATPNKTNSFLTTNFREEDIKQLKEEKPDLLSVDEQEDFSLANEDSATSRLDCEKSKIERLIHLPYSLEALKCLTDGYCEPSFFPVLQEKMNIYSKYKIFIIRREGRRIFCCSGCPSSSPHGMGDVKKHILGVHARIPERFKAAAMHCSRLSREDTSLLPDHLLLQLAKMKWKGSVIKPLAELTVEDRIKNFSKKSWEGKPGKPQGKQYYSMVDQPGSEIDGKEQSKETKPEKGSSVKLEQEGTMNEDSCPSTGPVNEILVPEHFFVEIHERQSEVAYKCSVCEYESRFVGNSKGHIVREHLGIPAHTCSICEQLFNSRSGVVAHHEQDHGNGIPFTLAHYGPYKMAMSKISLKEMPSAQRGVASKSRRTADGKRNSFLQNSQELSDLESHLI